MTKAVKKTETVNNKKNTVKVTKGVVIELGDIISKIKIGGVSKETMFDLIDFKLAINKIIEESKDRLISFMNEIRKSIDPDNETVFTKEQENDLNKQFREYEVKILNEEIDIVPLKITKDDFFSLVKDNNFTMIQVEILNTVIQK